MQIFPTKSTFFLGGGGGGKLCWHNDNDNENVFIRHNNVSFNDDNEIVQLIMLIQSGDYNRSFHNGCSMWNNHLGF